MNINVEINCVCYLLILDRIELTENIAMLAAKLGRENNLPFDVADLVIAAPTFDLKAELATHNVKHFKLIPKLKICDLRKISTDN